MTCTRNLIWILGFAFALAGMGGAQTRQAKWILEPLRFPAAQSWGSVRDLFFFSPDTGWIAGSGGIYPVSAGTMSVGAAATGSPGRDIHSLHFPDRTVGYAVGTGATILKTLDAGKTWEPLALPLAGEGRFRKVRFDSPDTGFVFAEGDGLFRTFDGGKNFEAITPPWGHGCQDAAHPCRFQSLGGGRLRMPSAIGGSVSVSEDYGTTWDTLSLPGGVSRLPFFLSSEIIIAATESWDVLRSEDGGTTWTNLGLLEPNARGWNRFHFTDPDTGFLLSGSHSISRLYKTTSGGQEWSLLASLGASGVEEDIPFAVVGRTDAFMPDSSERFVHIANGVGRWFFPVPRNLGLYHASLLEDSSVIVFDTAGAMYKSQDRGKSWIAYGIPNLMKEALGRFPNDIEDFDFPDAQVGYIGTQFGLYKTMDGGRGWSSPLLRHGISTLKFLNPDTGFVYAEGSAFFRTSDGGVTWDTLSVHNLGWRQDFHFWNANDGMSFLYRGTSRTQDGGESWTTSDFIPGPNPKIQWFSDSVLIVSHGFGVHKSMDRGETWEPMIDSMNAENSLGVPSLSMSDSENGWMLLLGDLMKTTDGGKTWSIELEQACRCSQVLRLPGQEEILLLGEDTMYRLVGKSGDVAIRSRSQSKTNLVLRHGVLEYDLPLSGRVVIRPLDWLGRKGSPLFDGYRHAGKHRWTLPRAAHKNAGALMLQLPSENRVLEIVP